MTYANNPQEMYPEAIDLSLPKEEMERSVMRIVRSILAANESVAGAEKQWTGARDEDIEIVDLCGGITNRLFLVEHTKVADSRVIVRTFGNGTEMFIDRGRENTVFSCLSRAKFGPSFHGLFIDGRVEGYIPSNTLLPPQMKDPEIFPKVAAVLAELHNFDLPDIREPAGHYWLWDKIRLFFKLTDSFRFEDATKLARLEALAVPRMFQELEQLQQQLLAIYERLVAAKDGSDRHLGRLHAFEQALCHNDLLSGNILLYDPSKEKSAAPPPRKDVYIIDYEYAAFNYRGFDLANHFCEFGGFDFDIVNEFPSDAVQKEFIRSYLAGHMGHHAATASFVQGVQEVVSVMCLASHLFWGSWAVVQSGYTALEFDYLAYAKLRFDGYFYHKDLFARQMADLLAL